MPDRFSKEVRSRIMSRIRSKNTGIERLVFADLRRRGLSFQRHYRGAPGTPDVARPSRRLAVFIDGDFWHGYRYPTWKKLLKDDFWRAKIERNRRRDRNNFAKLRRRGWRFLRVWEHDLQADAPRALNRIEIFLK